MRQLLDLRAGFSNSAGRLALAAALMVGLLAWQGCGDSASSEPSPKELLADAPESSFHLGEQFEGFPVTRVLTDPTAPHRISFLYGDCVPPPVEGGCAPPFEVQNWDLCERSPSRPIDTLDLIHGAPSDRRGGGIELYTGDTTIVVFGDQRRLRDAAEQLRQGDAGEAAESFDPPRVEDC